MPRPLSELRFEFVHETSGDAFTTVQTGRSPCLARQAAVQAKEDYLKAHPELPAENWRLAHQIYLRLLQNS